MPEYMLGFLVGLVVFQILFFNLETITEFITRTFKRK